MGSKNNKIMSQHLGHCAKLLLNRYRENKGIGTIVFGLSQSQDKNYDANEPWQIMLDSHFETDSFKVGRFISHERLQELKLQMIAEDIDSYCVAIEMPVSCLVDSDVSSLFFCHLHVRGMDDANISFVIKEEGDNFIARGIGPDSFKDSPLVSRHMRELLSKDKPSKFQISAARMALANQKNDNINKLKQ